MPKTPSPSDVDLLRQHAEELWERQQEVFAAAAQVAREAGRQGASYAREEVAPRVRGAVSTGAEFTGGKVLPAVSNTLATVAALGDKRVRQALSGIGALRGISVPAVVVLAARRGIGVGGWIGIGVGVLAIGAIGYAVWQTLRADDDLWVEDEAPESTGS